MTVHLDRAAGVLLGQACGDALGVPYEFGPALPDSVEPVMSGGGPWNFDPGEYSDDTAMAVCIAEVSATGADLTGDDALDEIAQRFLDWAADAKDVGAQTRQVFAAARHGSGSVGRRMLDASRAHAAAHPGRVGNGALMRTAIVGLTRLDDRDATAAAARAVAELTHADPLGPESCVLWSDAVRRAVNGDELDLLAGLDLLPADRRDQWAAWIDEATGVDPRTFARNGFTVWALQAAWAAITWTPQVEPDPAQGRFPAQHLAEATKNAVRAGDDTDTVAAIAGGLLGAYWGQSAIPLEWTRRVHGYGGHRASGLVSLAHRTALRGGSAHEWPLAERMANPEYTSARPVRAVHPHDEGVILGSYGVRDHGCDAVVSLCRIGTADFAAAGVEPQDHVMVRMVDREDPAENPHLDFVMADTARTIKTLRDEGKRVFVHCVAAHARTPAAGIAYSRLLGVPLQKARADMARVLPGMRGSGVLWDSTERLQPLKE
ncbi:ADP-ribosylglycohydrolase family protein [Aeromicrobium wangtongii]|uniref:ADP-ribosylglycohydrolase family protein n=1 Tax=Aeromicrobium wangtongii TaxID=2969247 RepID=A0ABY5M3B2_9ACTN|nr:ADP-ribosylglycohydrolase family protein [Aeromicrobium wangtongii]MCD9198305.1 ADP-ribosylglycohydrolase family protein [Aeromicrobium wangtongii]UUP12337.1 ADP-ribosylglycohydrolase family protein [Aeromicrobium wangtongii]